jgi:hypothetical protein
MDLQKIAHGQALIYAQHAITLSCQESKTSMKINKTRPVPPLIMKLSITYGHFEKPQI